MARRSASDSAARYRGILFLSGQHLPHALVDRILRDGGNASNAGE